LTENCGFLMDEWKERKVQNTAKAKKIHLSYSNFPCASLFFFVFVYMPFFDNMVSSSSLMKNISNHKKNKKTVKFVKTKPFLFIALNTTAQMKLISSIKKEQYAFQKHAIEFSQVKSYLKWTMYLFTIVKLIST